MHQGPAAADELEVEAAPELEVEEASELEVEEVMWQGFTEKSVSETVSLPM